MVQRVGAEAQVQATQQAARQESTSQVFGDVFREAVGAQAEKTAPLMTAGVSQSATLFPGLQQMTGGGSLESGILMLCLMLSQAGGFAGPMALALISRLAAQVDVLPPEAKEELRKETMDSDYRAEVLDQVDEQVFNHAVDADNYPYEAWRACSPQVTNAEGDRGPANLRRVIDQFSVETNGRYEVNKRGRNDTYCNIFAWDVTSAMGAEIPHYIDRATGEPRVYPDTKGASELNANATYDWLARHAEKYGWRRVSESEAQELANRGFPAVGVYKNPSGHGHIQVVCPSRDGRYNAEKGVTVAQAGSTLTGYAYTGDLSRRDRSQIAYYAHE